MEKLKRRIKALSLGKMEQGSIGFITYEDENKWYNIHADADVLKQLIREKISKGAVIEFGYNNGVVGDITLLKNSAEPDKNWGDDMTNFETLLADAHNKFEGKFNIKTEMISVDYEKKRAIFNACVSIENGDKVRVFTAHGDSEGIKSEMIQPHFIRMAETRAIARALRFATNNAKVAQEET